MEAARGTSSAFLLGRTYDICCSLLQARCFSDEVTALLTVFARLRLLLSSVEHGHGMLQGVGNEVKHSK